MTGPLDTAPPFDLYDRADLLLRLVVDGMTRHRIGLPGRRYVAFGSQVAYDDEQVTVTPSTITPGFPGRPEGYQHTGAESQAARFIVCIVRDVPSGSADGAGLPTPPTVGELNEASGRAARDVAGLYGTLTEIRSAGTFVDRGTPFSVVDVHQEGPLGGVAAVVGTIDVGLF